MRLRHLLLPVSLCASSALAQVFPLSENTWSNPDFVKRFVGSYGFDTAVTPSITTEEKTIFETIAPLIGTDPTKAVAEIQAVLKPESSPALYYTLGNLHFQAGRLPEAEQAYRQAIAKFPSFLRAYKNLGIVYVQAARYEEATTMLLKAVELGGQGADVYGMLGFAYLNRGDAVSSLRAYEHALFFQPDSRDWRMGKVQCLMNLNRHDDAIAMIGQLVEQFPGQRELLMLQANAFIAKNDPVSAAATLEVLRSTGSMALNAQILLGDIYLNLAQTRLALECYQAAAAHEDLAPDRALRIARRLGSMRAWPEFDAYLAALTGPARERLAPAETIELLNLQAQSDLAQNRAEAAAEKLAQVVQREPLNGRALLLLADYYWQTDEIERATLYYDRAAQLEAFAPEALVQQARMAVAQRDFQRAVPLLEKAQSLKPQTHIAQYLERVSSAARSAMR